MLKRLYEKSRIGFALLWIGLYCVLMSAADALSALSGVEKAVTLPVGALLCAVLLLFLHKHGLLSSYGLCLPKVKARKMLFYISILLMLSANLWYGFSFNFGLLETMLYILSMFCVGFLEEAIFRGLLFEAMRKDNPRAAIIVSSVTFGIGHIINLFNGAGAALLSNLLQVVYATAAGFMFVMIYYRSGSLLVPIAAHGIFNALSAFSGKAGSEPRAEIVSALLLTAITLSYGLYLAIPPRQAKDEERGAAMQ